MDKLEKADVDEFLELLRQYPDYTIFVSVQFGCERGLVEVAYDSIESTLDYMDESVFNPQRLFVEYEINHDTQAVAVGGW